MGHALLKWGGSQEEHITKQLQVAFPEIEDIYVLEAFRSQGIGSQVIAFAERLVSEKGYKHIGLSVGVTNEPARRLYNRLCYRDAHLGEYTEQGEYVDSMGNRNTWELTLIYLIKQLSV